MHESNLDVRGASVPGKGEKDTTAAIPLAVLYIGNHKPTGGTRRVTTVKIRKKNRKGKTRRSRG